MTRKYFGTDGIRGKANQFPMTADMAMKVAMATALTLKENSDGEHQNRAIIGKDTRISCYMLEQAMTAGFVAMGIDTFLVGPIPTPGIAMLTRSMRADVGVMISASHNPYEDNGIKLFGPDGYKLSDDIEAQIEARIDSNLDEALVAPRRMGRASRLDDALGRYVEFIKSSFRRQHTLEGMKVVVDCANGAAYKVAPQVLWEMEAEVISMGVRPNGYNINDKCGATDTKALQEMVVAEGADIGIALDGDADRLIMVDEKGQVVDGDQLMALLASTFKDKERLSGDAVVSTVMSNFGLEKYLHSIDLKLERTAVGDRYVVERMREGGFNLGGEQSGHIVMSDFGTTGDGLLAALQVLIALKYSGKPASEALHLFDPYPQILKNVRYEGQNQPLDDETVKEAIKQAEQTLSNDGRLVVRASGTEPVIRVMAEGGNSDLIQTVVDDLCLFIERQSKSA